MEENKNLEDFIKRRLESGEYHYQESDWLLMEKRLDAAGMVPVGSVLQNMKPVLLVLILVTLAFLGGWLLRGIFVTQEPVLSISESISQNSFDPANNSTALGSENIVDEDCEEEANPNETAQMETTATGKSATVFPKTTEVSKETKSKSRTPKGSVNGIELLNRNYRTQSLAYINGLEPSATGDVHEVLMHKVPISNFGIVEVAKEDEAHKASLMRNFSFGFSISPDFNSVGFNRNGSVTAKPGMQIYYELSPKWTGSTGIFYNRKKYETNGEDYSPPPGYWVRRTKGVIPDEIYGSCSVIDIPLSMYYKWKDSDRFSFSAGLGLNSYFLLDEDYFWTFDSPNPGAEDGWRTDKNSTAYGGLITFSVALGVKLTERSELVIEPYFKQPLRSIGWGNVEMYGTGTQFTFKFH